MILGDALGHEDLDVLVDDLFLGVSKELLGLLVEVADLAVCEG